MTMHDVEEAALGEVRARAADLRRLNLDIKNASDRITAEKKLLEQLEAQQREARTKLANAVERLCNIKPAPHDHSMWFPRVAWDTPNGELICRIAHKRTGKNPVDIRLVENKDAWCVTLDDYSQIEVTGIEVAGYQP